MKNLVVQAFKAGCLFTGLLIIYNAGREQGIEEGIKHGRILGKMEAGLDFAKIFIKHDEKEEKKDLVC